MAFIRESSSSAMADRLRSDLKNIEYEEQRLKENDILDVFHYVPLHSAPAGAKFGRFHGEDRYTTNTFERLLRLPMYYGLKPEEVEYIADKIKEFYK